MGIIYTQSALDSLIEIKVYIIRVDSKTRADKFITEIRKQIRTISFMPYKYRKSLYYDKENVRDMIFKGYTIVYYIQEKEITITEIFRQSNR